MSCFTVIWKQGKFFILVAISCTTFIVRPMQSTFLSLPNLHRASSLPWGGGLPYLAYKHTRHFTIKVWFSRSWVLNRMYNFYCFELGVVLDWNPLKECGGLQWTVLSSVLFYTRRFDYASNFWWGIGISD